MGAREPTGSTAARSHTGTILIEQLDASALARGLGTFLSNLSDEFFCVMDGTYFVCSLVFYAARASCQRRRSLEAARPLVHSTGLTPLRAAL